MESNDGIKHKNCPVTSVECRGCSLQRVWDVEGVWCRENGNNPKTYYYHQRIVYLYAFEALPIPAEEQEAQFLDIPQDISHLLKDETCTC